MVLPGSGVPISDQFRGVTKLIEHGRGGRRKASDYLLTRKEEIAFAQSYFAVQTRKQELFEERLPDRKEN